MGCGQSKLNLYPRRNKKRKGNGAKKSGAVDKDTDEEEGSTGEATPEEAEEEPDNRQHALSIADHPPAFRHCKSFDIMPTDEEAQRSDTQAAVLPVIIHQPTVEVSASQQNFFKMLDEKIEKGKDYDSTSETEVQKEQERKRNLIEQWLSMSQLSQSARCSPPTPARRRLTRSISRASERQCTSSTSNCYKHQESSPNRRCTSAQMHEPRPSSSERDPNKSPVRRSQSAGSNWKSNPKVAPFPKPEERKEEAVAGCSKDSQITYNPTFQNQSPAHSTKDQPYKAQIVTYPLSQQVAPPSPKYISPPEEYQDADENMTVAQVATQSSIYYIQASNTAPDIAQQRQQTAINLQQYVAMKQAQQQMFTSYMQNAPHAFPGERANTPLLCDGEELAAQYGHPGLRPHSAPNRQGIQDVSHVNMPMWCPLPPVISGPRSGGQVPPEMQYYPQSQCMSMFRANSAGSAGTLTRYHKKDGPERSMQSINMVRGKPVGQIVAVGGQELAVSSTVSDSPSPASVSTDSGVSPGTSAPSSKSSFSTTPPTASANDTFNSKPKKKTTNRTLKVSKSLDA